MVPQHEARNSHEIRSAFLAALIEAPRVATPADLTGKRRATMLPDQENIVIPCRGSARLDDVLGVTLRVMRGSVWITQSDSREDVSLDAGESFCVTRSGPTLVAACHDAPFSEIALERPVVVALTLGERLRRMLFRASATPSIPDRTVAMAGRPDLELATSRSPELQSHHRKLMLGFVAAVALPAIAIAFFAASDGLAAAPVANAAPRAHAAAAASVDDPITGQFSRFALNALLVPLIDDHEPANWTDVGMCVFCGPATSVDVDGRPLVPGARLPATAFTVRWHIDQCRPLARASFELSGDVELLVFHDDNGLSAVVNAQRLKVSTSKGSSHVNRPFAASMSLLDRPAGPAPSTAP